MQYINTDARPTIVQQFVEIFSGLKKVERLSAGPSVHLQHYFISVIGNSSEKKHCCALCNSLAVVFYTIQYA